MPFTKFGKFSAIFSVNTFLALHSLPSFWDSDDTMIPLVIGPQIPETPFLVSVTPFQEMWDTTFPHFLGSYCWCKLSPPLGPTDTRERQREGRTDSSSWCYRVGWNLSSLLDPADLREVGSQAE